MKLNAKKILSSMLIFGIVITTLFFIGCTKSNGDLNSQPSANENVKVVQLSSNDEGMYNPQLITVKAGTTLRIVGDPNTLVDGMDTVVVDGYNVQKKISPNDNVLEFEANQKGEFLVHCANGMGNAKLIVE